MENYNIKIDNKGLTPPSATDFEEAVLGAVLIAPDAVDAMLMLIQREDVFYLESHKYIFVAIKSLFEEGNPIDLITVSQKLRQLNKLEIAGGDYYLVQLTQKIASSAHVEYHCRLLLQKFIGREIIKFNAQTTMLAYDESTDMFELMGKLQHEFDMISNITITGQKSNLFSKNMKDLGERIDFLSTATETEKLVGVHTGFSRVNKFTGGYQPGELIVLAARPGMGKTSLVLKTALENVKIDNPVGFISLEMSAMQLTARSVAIDTDFHLSQLIKTGFEKQKYFESFNNHSHRMSKYQLYIDDSPESEINSVVLKARYWKRKYGIKLLIIDYIQLMTNSAIKGNREQEISSISRRLKLLAKELEIPVIALSQLSRAVETRGSSKRPLLSDLRESGAIEQDADIIQFIYRPDYYKIDIQGNDEFDWMTSEGSNTEFIFAKYRAGSVATTGLRWVGDKTKFEDPTEHMQSFNDDEQSCNETFVPLGNPDDAFDNDNPF